MQQFCHRKNAIYGCVINLTRLQHHVKERNSEQILDARFSAGKKQNMKMLNVSTQKKLAHFSVD